MLTIIIEPVEVLLSPGVLEEDPEGLRGLGRGGGVDAVVASPVLHAGVGPEGQQDVDYLEGVVSDRQMKGSLEKKKDIDCLPSFPHLFRPSEGA